VTGYAAEVRDFHDWLHRATEEAAGPLVADYVRCTRRIKSVSARSLWNIILQQVVIAGKRDPYQYLDQYLTQVELDEVNSLPHRSKEQVDLIIRMVDEYDSCDDELRRIIYLAFGTSDA
jgi:hypothetical protein